MKERPLTAKQAAFVQCYADPGSKTYNNAAQSMAAAGYSHLYANKNATHITASHGVKAGILAMVEAAKQN